MIAETGRLTTPNAGESYDHQFLDRLGMPMVSVPVAGP